MDGATKGPAGEMQRLFSLCWALTDIEEILENRRFRSKRTYLAPMGCLLGLLVFYLSTFQAATQQEHDADRLWTFGGPWMVAGALSIAGIFVIKAANHHLMKTQEDEYESALAMRKKTVGEIIRSRDQLFASPFILVVNHRILTHVPHAEWLRCVLLEVPTTHPELRSAIEQALYGLQQAIEEWAKKPEEQASANDLTIDLSALHQRCMEIGIARIPPLPEVISV